MFLENIPGKEYVNHKDGNKLNNNCNNLEWCTKSENTIHSFKNYLQDNITNQYGNFSIISKADIEYIKENYWRTMITKKLLAEYFDLTIGQIDEIIYNRHKNKKEYDDKIKHIWSLKANYEKLGQEIGKCSRSIRHIKNKIGDDFNYEIYEHISNELQKCF